MLKPSLIALGIVAGTGSLMADDHPSDVRDWRWEASTRSDCPFAASLYLSRDRARGLLAVRLGGVRKTVALEMAEHVRCQRVVYRQNPLPSLPPTLDVEGTALCQGSEPRYMVTLSLSGVQRSCRMARTI